MSGLSRKRIRARFLWVLNNTLNRVTTPLARSGHGPFSLIRHVGRKSGRAYETPVILVRVADGFVAELAYGENVNWYRNAWQRGVASWSFTVERTRSRGSRRAAASAD